jgi:hypothetical protein
MSCMTNPVLNLSNSDSATEQGVESNKALPLIEEGPPALQLHSTSVRLQNLTRRQLQLLPLSFDAGACVLGLIFVMLWFVQPLPWLALILTALGCSAWKGLPGVSTKALSKINFSNLRDVVVCVALATVVVLVGLAVSGLGSMQAFTYCQLDSECTNVPLILFSNALLLLYFGVALGALFYCIFVLLTPILHLIVSLNAITQQLFQFDLYLTGRPTEAKIVRLGQITSSNWIVGVSFEAADERGIFTVYKAQVEVFDAQCRRLKEGDVVTVLYNKHNPKECLIYELGQYRIRMSEAKD